MTGTGTFLISVGVALGVLVLFFLVYYLANVSNNIYQIRVQMRRELDNKMDDIEIYVDKEMEQRTRWMRGEIQDQVREGRVAFESEIDQVQNDMVRAVGGLQDEIAALRKEIAAIRQEGGRQEGGKNAD